MLGLMEQVATLAGDQATATSARERAAQVFAAFQERFWDPATRTYRNDPGQTVFSQHQNAIALGLGLVPADRVQAVGDALAADVRARGNHLATGIMGTRFLWHALTMTGHLDEAFAVATQTTYPSYGYWIDELGWTVTRRELGGRHPLAQPPHVRHDRAVAVRHARRLQAAQARL